MELSSYSWAAALEMVQNVEKEKEDRNQQGQKRDEEGWWWRESTESLSVKGRCWGKHEFHEMLIRKMRMFKFELRLPCLKIAGSKRTKWLQEQSQQPSQIA